jgi:hypothetical protein
MIANAIGSAEAAGGDDFLIVNALAVMAGHVPVGHVPFARQVAKLQIGRHKSPPIAK